MMTVQELIDFESEVAELFNTGKLPFCNHLSGGNELQLINRFKDVQKDDWVFSTWRSHYHYLLKGGDKNVLLEKIKLGQSMHINDKELRFFSSAIVGGCLPIAAGVAKAIKMRGGTNNVWCFVGDGGEDQGVFYESARYISSWNLPCTIFVEDNGLAVDTSTKDRWGSSIRADFPCVKRYEYIRKYPHVQTGKICQEYM